jgi:ACS family hexuronate transporter-like MFS transporter
MKEARSFWKWYVCGALLLATMLNYMDRLALSQTATYLKSAIHLNDERYGRLEESFSYAFAAGSILFGFLADRFGPRFLYPIALIGWSLCGIASPLAARPEIGQLFAVEGVPGSGEFHWLLLCRTMLGFFEAGHWPCALLTVRAILTDKDRPFGNGILQSGASLGAVLTPQIVRVIRELELPWQTPFLTFGIGGLLWVPLWFFLIRPGMVKPVTKKAVQDQPPISPVRFTFQLLTLATIVITISMAWQIHRAWQPKYLKEFHHYSESDADNFTSLYYLCADLGCLASGALVTWLVARRVTVPYARLIAFAICIFLASLSAILPMVDRGPFLMLTLLLIGAGTLGAHPQYYALVQDLPARHMGFLSGLLAAMSWIPVGRMQGELGKLVQRTGSYDLGFQIIGFVPLVGLAALIAWVVLGKTKPAPSEAGFSR